VPPRPCCDESPWTSASRCGLLPCRGESMSSSAFATISRRNPSIRRLLRSSSSRPNSPGLQIMQKPGRLCLLCLTTGERVAFSPMRSQKSSRWTSSSVHDKSRCRLLCRHSLLSLRQRHPRPLLPLPALCKKARRVLLNRKRRVLLWTSLGRLRARPAVLPARFVLPASLMATLLPAPPRDSFPSPT